MEIVQTLWKSTLHLPFLSRRSFEVTCKELSEACRTAKAPLSDSAKLELQRALARGTFQVQKEPHCIYKPGKAPQLSEKLDAPTRIVACLLRQRLKPVLDAQLSPSVWSYRKGRSLQDAAIMIRETLQSHPWVVRLDICDFFANVPVESLLGKVGDLIDPSLRSAFPWVEEIVRGEFRGLFPSCGLIKDLSNFALADFDKEIGKLNLPYLRYVDDLLLYCHSQGQAQKVYATAARILSAEGYQVNRKKAFIASRSEGFNFLGWHFYHHHMRPSDRSVERFRKQAAAEISLLNPFQPNFRRLSKLIYGFGHQYKGGAVASLFKKLDSEIRANVRKALGAGLQLGNINLRTASLRKMGLRELLANVLKSPVPTVAPVELQNIAKTVHGELGKGLQEEFYVKALCEEAQHQNLKPIREAPVSVFYRSHGLGTLFWDLLIKLGDHLIGVEVKAIDSISLRHLLKARSQLKFSNIDAAYLINFSPKRPPQLYRIEFTAKKSYPPWRQLHFAFLDAPVPLANSLRTRKPCTVVARHPD